MKMEREGIMDVMNQAFEESRKEENIMYHGGFVDIANRTYKEAVREKVMKRFDIKKAIFNKPYTIVIWEDGTKTIVKCAEGQAYDKYTGLVTCFLKRGFGDETIYPRVRKQIRKVLADSVEKEECKVSVEKKEDALRGIGYAPYEVKTYSRFEAVDLIFSLRNKSLEKGNGWVSIADLNTLLGKKSMDHDDEFGWTNDMLKTAYYEVDEKDHSLVTLVLPMPILM